MAGVGEVGYRVTGMDLSAEQASATRRLLAESGVEARVFVGNVSRLPLSDEQFDFAYSINVFHHLETLEDQVEALREAARVIRPGGLFFLHEINVTNQLFRFHMNYVFPLIHDIDEGTERWIKPKAVPDVPGLTLAGVEYLTFVPDFVPKSLFRLALPIENRLERSFLKSWSAHYMAVFRRT